jgi:glycosyltransferase involved in cell wall biosynthesis
MIFLISTSKPTKANRVANFWFNIACELTSRGHLVLFVMDKFANIDDNTKLNNILFYCYPEKRPTGIKSGLFIRKIFKTHKVDVVISNFGSHNLLGILGYLNGTRNNITYIHTTSKQLEIDQTSSKITQMLLFLRKRFIYNLNTLILTNSQGTKEDSMLKFKIRNNKIEVFHLLVEDEFQVFKKKKQICVIGRLHPSKGQFNLLIEFKKLIEIHSEYKLIVVGEGEEKEKLIRLSESLGISKSVIFLGNLSRDEVNKVLAESEISVSSSVSEAFGLVMVESLMQGTPILATRTEGSLEIIDDGNNGRFFDFEFEASFVKGFESIQNNLEKYSIQARKSYLDKFSISNIPKSVNLMESLLN